MILAWNTNTTPIRELNRRKFADIVVILNEGLSTKFGEDGVSLLAERSSTGITCWRSLSISNEL